MVLALDLTGALSANKITGETFSVSPTSPNPPLIFLEHGPFYGTNSSVKYTPSGGTEVELVLGADYAFVGIWINIAPNVGGVYSAIYLLNNTLNGIVSVDYQALGGGSVVNTSSFTKFFASAVNKANPTFCQSLPQAQYGTISTNALLVAAQIKFAGIVLDCAAYANPHGTSFTYIPGVTTGDTSGTGGSTGGGDTGGGDTGGGTTTGPITASQITDSTAIGRALITAANGAAAQVVIGLGSAATQQTSAFATAAQGLKADSALQSIPIASATVLGGFKVGANLSISADGTLSAPALSGNQTVISTNITDSTTIGRTLLTATNVSAAQTALGLGSAALVSTTTFATAAQGLKADTALQTVSSTTILDATAIGRSLMTAASTTNAQTVLGLGSAALVSSSTFATAAQGLKADTALQSISAATASVIGGVKAGTGTLIAGDGTLSVTPASVGAVASSLIGIANGVAPLDSTGKIGTSFLPTTLFGAMSYQGTWNASANTPTLISGAGTKGYYYSVVVSGSTTIDGINQWNVGDKIAYNGTVWEKFDGVANEVVSVAGRTGAVTLSSVDLTDATTLGKQLITATSASAAQTFLGLGSAATQPSSAFATAAQGTLASTALQTVSSASLTDATVLGKTLLTTNTAGEAQTVLGLASASTHPATDFATAAQGVLATTALQAVPVATESTLGGVKVGAGLGVGVDGLIYATNTFGISYSGTVGVGNPIVAALPAGWTAATWQWYRVDANGVSDLIAGANTSTYIQTADDDGYGFYAEIAGLIFTSQNSYPSATIIQITPTITTAPNIVSGLSQSTLVFTTAVATGTPTPTIVYDLLDDVGGIIAANITNGGYTLTQAGQVIQLRATATNFGGSDVSTSTTFTVGPSIDSYTLSIGGQSMLFNGYYLSTAPDAEATGTLYVDGSPVYVDGSPVIVN